MRLPTTTGAAQGPYGARSGQTTVIRFGMAPPVADRLFQDPPFAVLRVGPERPYPGPNGLASGRLCPASDAGTVKSAFTSTTPGTVPTERTTASSSAGSGSEPLR